MNTFDVIITDVLPAETPHSRCQPEATCSAGRGKVIKKVRMRIVFKVVSCNPKVWLITYPRVKLSNNRSRFVCDEKNNLHLFKFWSSFLFPWRSVTRDQVTKILCCKLIYLVFSCKMPSFNNMSFKFGNNVT